MGGQRLARVFGVALVAAVMILTCTSGCLWADDSKPGEEKQSQSQVFTLGEIEVVGEAEEEKNTTVEAVTSEEMELFNRYNVADAVNLLPGVTLNQVGARNETTVYVRGLDIKHVPIFQDGIPIYVPYDGYPDLGRFTTFDLSEIVVSKGFTSVLYGPNTMGGAINMISRRPVGLYETDGGAGYETGDTYHAYGNFGTNQGKWYAQGGASYVNSEYFYVSDNFDPTETQGNGRRDNSYYRDRKFNVKFGFTPNQTDEYAISYINQHGQKGVPPYAGTDPDETVRYWQWPYWDKESLYFNSLTAIGDQAYLKSRIYYDKFKNSLYSYDDENYDTMTKKYAFKSWYDDHTIGGSVEGGISFASWNTLKAAFHYKRDYHEEHDDDDPHQKFEDEIMSLGVEDTINFRPDLYLIAGVSGDRLKTIKAQDLVDGQLEDFPKDTIYAVNGQVGLFYKVFDNKGVAHASISRKTRLPSIKDKYSYRMGRAIPNPSLDAEVAYIYELGYQHLLFGDFQIETTLFFNDISDYILLTNIPDPSDPTTTIEQNQNIGDVNLYGLEFWARGHIIKQLELGVNYTLTEADNNSNDEKLTNIPKHKVFVYALYKPIQPLGILADLQYDSSRYSSTNGVRITDDFILVNTKIYYEFFNHVTVEFGVDNVFDVNYAYDEGFPEPGRTYFGNLRWSF